MALRPDPPVGRSQHGFLKGSLTFSQGSSLWTGLAFLSEVKGEVNSQFTLIVANPGLLAKMFEFSSLPRIFYVHVWLSSSSIQPWGLQPPSAPRCFFPSKALWSVHYLGVSDIKMPGRGWSYEKYVGSCWHIHVGPAKSPTKNDETGRKTGR